MSEQDINVQSPQNNDFSIKISPLFALEHPRRDKPIALKDTPIVDLIFKQCPPGIDDDIADFFKKAIFGSTSTDGFIKIKIIKAESLEKAKDYKNYVLNFLNNDFIITSEKFDKQSNFILTLKQKKFKEEDDNESNIIENSSVQTLHFDIIQNPNDKSKLQICLGNSTLTILSNGPYGHYLKSMQIKNQKSLNVIQKKGH